MAEEKKNPIVEHELEILQSWNENKIFEKSLDATKNGPQYSFYDGPPFATGTPHYGHLVASVMKDVVPRYWTMKGHYVERRWGWDCHGLPIENIVEKELGLKSKKDIEDIGIEKFNEMCRSKVLGYVEEWKKTMNRFGRWADMENSYKTMDLNYMESVWWVFKELWDKGLVYEGYKSMHVCPRCETTLSQQEVSEGYRDIKDLSVIAKFELVDEPDTFVLAWTTTPWTLPGNVALAVGEDVDYVKVKVDTLNGKIGIDQNTIVTDMAREGAELIMQQVGSVYFILARARLSDVMKNGGVKEDEYEVVKEFKGSELFGKKYNPLFPYYLDKEVPNKENLYTIATADFVTTEDGTGVVHIAPAYGEDDMRLGQEKNLAFIQNVTLGGVFKDEVEDFKGMHVKPAGDTQATDVLVIKYLAGKGLLFAKEKYEHSYPHCWRCDTPLINYATSSWFVKVTDVKERALKLATKINWSPEHIKEGRFGNWLEGARDWSISRQRFWASCIPIWKCDCGEMKVFGSAEELDELKIEKNKIYGLRHGESEKNIEHIFDHSEKSKLPLTAKGVEDIKEVITDIQKLKIDVIVSSTIFRAKQTAELVAADLGLEVIFDSRLNETNYGDWQNKSDDTQEAREMLIKWRQEGGYAPDGGESLEEESERVVSLWNELNEKYSGKNILIVSHGDPLRILHGYLAGHRGYEIYENYKMPAKGNLSRLVEKTTDLHKHIIDKIEVPCSKCGKNMKRVPDVLDTWFDSGSMPYAQEHFPFENGEKFEKTFPAEFIAEGVDQTRAWFYYLHVIATAIQDKIAFKNVIVNGIVLAEDGKKMSKRLQNYPEPEIIMEKYGADAMRYYLLSSPVMAAENFNFSEVGVREAAQKTVMLLNNILNFYSLYENENAGSTKFNNPLDQWLLAKLNVFIKEVTENMDGYDLIRAVRPIQTFIDEFSTWWLRRSRDRFKSDNEADKQQALSVFKIVLLELSKVMAPFMPFNADYVYRHAGGEKESVHLEAWPLVRKEWENEAIITAMDQVRKIVELGLAARAESGIKIRQPLSTLKVIGYQLPDELATLIADEVNVKTVVFEKGAEIKAELDTTISEELKIEGMVRELTRSINDIRKKQGLTIGDMVKVLWSSSGDIINKVFADTSLRDELMKATLTQEFIAQKNGGTSMKVNEEDIVIEVTKI